MRCLVTDRHTGGVLAPLVDAIRQSSEQKPSVAWCSRRLFRSYSLRGWSRGVRCRPPASSGGVGHQQHLNPHFVG